MPESELEIILTISIATAILLMFAGFLIAFAQIFRQRQLRYLQEKSALEASLQAQYAQEILKSQIEVQNTTLQQIGEELHDNIGQLLSVARINLNILENLEQANISKEYIRQTNEIIGQSIQDLRGLTRSFDGDFVKDFGLEESLAHELQRIRKTNRYDTELNVSGKRYAMGYEKEIVLFRISQEILNNSLKHGLATRIVAHMNYDTALFTLSLKDNGKGFDNEFPSIFNKRSSGAGLRNMQRRAELIGARFVLETEPGKGTHIKIDLLQP